MKQKFYTNNNKLTGPEAAQSSQPSPGPVFSSTPGAVQAIDVVDLLDKCGEVLRREVQNLLMMTSTGKKLDSAASKDLVSYVKLLQEMQSEQKDALRELDTEELEKL